MKLTIAFGVTPDSNTPLTLYVDGFYNTTSDADCREVAEALRTTSFVQDTLGNPTNSYVTALAQTDIGRDVPLTE
jgi:hypothetical protein